MKPKKRKIGNLVYLSYSYKIYFKFSKSWTEGYFFTLNLPYCWNYSRIVSKRHL
jgi:hypothetical protein